MCKVSDKLILCSCTQDINFEKNHWELNRFVDGKNDIILGEPNLPCGIDPLIVKTNIEKLTNILNAADCFDFEAAFKDKDQLVLYFKNEMPLPDEKMYVFEFKNKKWKWIQTEPLMLTWYHQTINQGYIEPLTNQKSSINMEEN